MGSISTDATLLPSPRRRRGAFDRRERKLLVDVTGQSTDADRADSSAVLEDGDAAEEERKERVEARELGWIGPCLLGEFPRRCRIAARGGIRLALGVQPCIGRSTVHSGRRDQLPVGV